ncbi:MAG: hypothetical protein QGF03_02510 [SAR324 cluster bacterium]|nr:hypothetical protein [SAR324 cluster bacterium]
MARLWNNQYYQNPELAGIRKTLGDSMIGSYARDAGDLRGMLNAERTVEQVMRNKSAEGLAAQGPVLGGRLATLMGVKDPQADFLDAVSADYAWRKHRQDAAQAGAILGSTELEHALLGSKAGAADALAGQREQAGAYDAARTSRVTGQDAFINAMLDDPNQVSSYLRAIGQPPTSDPVANRTLAGSLLLAPNQAQAATALSTLQRTPQEQELLNAQIATEGSRGDYWEAYSKKRSAEAGDVVGDDQVLPPSDPIKIDVPWDETSFNDFTVEPLLYQSIIPLVQSGSAEDITKAVAALRRYFEPKKVRYILQQIKNELGGG